MASLFFYKPLTVLVTTGTTEAADALARSFDSAGHRVVYADSPPQQHRRAPRCVGCRVCVPAPDKDPAAYAAALCEAVRDEGVDVLVPTGGEVVVAAAHRFVLSAFCGVLLDEPDKIRRLGNRWRVARRARELGLLAPETRLVRSQGEVRRALAEMGDAVLMQAEPHAAGSAPVVRWCGGRWPRVDVSPQSPWVVQRWLAGEPLATYAVAHDGRLSAHVTCAFSAPLRPASAEGHPTVASARAAAGLTTMTAVDSPEVLEWTARFVEAERFTGQIGLSLMRSADGDLHICGCTPYATSAAKLFSAQPTWLDAFVVAPRGEPLQPAPGTNRRARIATAVPGWQESAPTISRRRWLPLPGRDGGHGPQHLATIVGRCADLLGGFQVFLRGALGRILWVLPRLAGNLAGLLMRDRSERQAALALPAEPGEAFGPPSGHSLGRSPFSLLRVPPEIASAASGAAEGRGVHPSAADGTARARRSRRAGS